MKKINKYCLPLACLLGIGGMTGMALASNNNMVEVKADAQFVAKLDKLAITNNVDSQNRFYSYTTNGVTFTGNGKIVKNGSYAEIAKGDVGTITISASNLAGKSISGFTLRIDPIYTLSNTNLVVSCGSTVLSNVSLVEDAVEIGNSSSPIGIEGGGDLVFTFNVGSGESNNLRVYDFTLSLYNVQTTSAVTIGKGSGLKSVYLSTVNNATSGDPSGTQYQTGTTVYGFVELDKGYCKQNTWTKVEGTLNTEGSKYCIGSATAGESNFGTISAGTITYYITYNLDGGTNHPDNKTSYKVTTDTFTIYSPTKEGYIFNGWTGSNGDVPQIDIVIPKGSIGALTFNANWTFDNYTITYNLNGGTVSEDNPTAYTSTTETFTLNNPTKDGYSFTGWTGTGLSEPTMTVTIEKGTIGNKEYTANWALRDEIQTVIDKINDIGGIDNVTYTDGCKAKIDAARAEYNLLIENHPSWASLVSNYQDLVDAEAKYQELEEIQTAADETIAKINAIGVVSYPDSGDKIDAAKAAYDQFIESYPSSAGLITNYDVLAAAIAEYANQKTAGANAVKVLIDNIGTVEYTQECKDKIDTARAAYNALTEEQKALIDPDAINALKAAEEQYSIAEVVYLINAIGEVEYKEECKAKIDAAREAYDALSDDAKASVSNYTTLTQAEETYASLAPKPNTNAALPSWAIALIIIGSLLVLFAGLYLVFFFLLNKWIIEGDKVVRVLRFKLGSKDGKERYLAFPCKFAYRNKEEVFNKKEDALK